MVGITAVVASLIAVAIELRQTQSAIVANTYQARAYDAIDKNWRLAESPVLGSILAKVSADPSSIDALTDVELRQVRALARGMRIDADNEYYQYRQGFLDEEYFESALKPRIARQARLWRSLGIEERRPSFKKFVDEQLAGADPQ
ncbi:MAG: hypothetical protein AAFN50_05465 [Pseudomonadota bacterium]